MADEAQTPSSWVEDGTKEVEPVTTETPAVGTVEVEATEAVEAVETAVAAETTEEVVQTFIDAKNGDEDFQIPDGVTVPRTIDGEVTYVSLADMMKGATEAQSSTDILAEIHKERSALGRDRASHEREVVRQKARSEYVTEQEDKLKGALSDPEKTRELEQHLSLMQTNPEYKALHERDWSNREVVVERDQLRQDRQAQATSEGVKIANGWLEDIGKDFPGVNVGRVAERFGQELTTVYDNAGNVVREATATLAPEDVRRIFESEAAYLATATQPFETKLEALAAKVESLMGTQDAETHNETTQHAVKRAKTTPITTGKGTPGTTPVAHTKFTPNELPERVQAWSDAG